MKTSIQTSMKTGISFVLVGVLMLSVLPGSAQDAPKPPAQATSGPTQTEHAEWAKSLAALNAPNTTWGDCFSTGDDLASLPPDVGFTLLQENWSKLTSVQARQQLMKAFYYALPFPLHPRNHLHILEALNLGATDPSKEVQQFAFEYLRQITLQNFANDPAAYRNWYEQSGKLALKDVLRDSRKALFERVKRVEGAEREQLLQEIAQQRIRPDDNLGRKAAQEAGLTDILAHWLSEPKASDNVLDGSLILLKLIHPEESYLRRVIIPLLNSDRSLDVRAHVVALLDDPVYRWAIEPILDTMKQVVLRDDGVPPNTPALYGMSQTLAKIGDPKVIPTLIGLISADDTTDTLYAIGWFGLTPLTGVPYDKTHNGAWWKDWWQKNRSKFPLETRNTPIPDYGKDDPAEAKRAQGDDRVAWLRQHATPIRSIDPNDDDFADLVPLIKQIGNARIVQLGEQSHGDGATFYAKERLIRFLHEKMGFDVLAWESGLFDCRQMEQTLHSDANLQQSQESGIFPIWSRSEMLRPLFHYVRSTYETSHPIEMTGFDCQFSSNTAFTDYPKALFAFFDKAEAAHDTAEQRKTLEEAILELMSGGYHPTPEKRGSYRNAIKFWQQHLADNETTLTKTHGAKEVDFMRHTLTNLSTYEEIEADPGGESPASNNRRDKAMAENLLWLAHSVYPNKKILVWAATLHLTRNAPTITVTDHSLTYKDTVPMGHTVSEALGKEVYTIAFTAYQGKAGNPFYPPTRLKRSEPETVEWLCHFTNQPYLFVDLRGLPPDHWLRSPLVARPLGYLPMQADWSQVYDALLFTDKMFPSSGYAPSAARTKPIVYTPAEQEIARPLEEFRKTAIVYNLTQDEVLAEYPGGYDPTRMKSYPNPEDWPEVLGGFSVVPDPMRFQRTMGDGKGYDPKVNAGYAFTSPLTVALEAKASQTLLFLQGIGPQGAVKNVGYMSLYCQGEMAGQIHIGTYATTVIRGDLTGTLTVQKTYSNTLIYGALKGKFQTNCAGVLYLLGGFRGEIDLTENLLNGGPFKVVVTGRTTQADLERIHGPGSLWLEDSDLTPGYHKVRELDIIVMKKQVSLP